MIYNWIKEFIKPKYFDENYQYFDYSYESSLERERIKAELNYIGKRWSNLEPRRLK